MKPLEHIPVNKQAKFLGEFFTHYVDKQGLGGIPKPDLDALIVYLYTKYSGKPFDAFELGHIFMLKEARVKSLYEIGLIKYSGLTEGGAWIEILDMLKNTKFELESSEKGQIRFKFENPALYKFFQKRLRVLGSTATFSSSFEIVTIPLDTFLELLDHIYDQSQTQFAATETDEIRPLVESVVARLGTSISKRKLKELRGEEGLATRAGKALDQGGKLANIGRFVLLLVQ